MAHDARMADTTSPTKTKTSRVLRGKTLTEVKGTETVSNLLADFEAIREGKSLITLHFTSDSEMREDMIPARVAQVDLFAALTDAERAIVIEAEAIKAKAKDAAKGFARLRVGRGKREVWTSRLTVKSK